MAQWEYDDSHTSCHDCIKFCKLKGKKVNCNECKRPKVLPENKLAYGLLIEYTPILTDGMGGISASGIRLVLDTEQIEMEERKPLIKKFMAYLKTAISTQAEQTKQTKG